ncbi:DnaB-like helicase N-terminal domain-containing protein [Actinacidiphila glaucinigra]|uniref:DnaB-like helicase N-terminal domain-containing protein n=1 Tax=Actinacidiphila glaucinigra TaxID=235986 RepID=UPI002E30ABC0|nr:DnaB-like helicase N-terminal domain-containing protein [Actinacidiphila glaucinigra]
MSNTLIGTPDPDQPPSEPVLRDEHTERTVLAALLRYPQLAAYLMAVLHATYFSSPACREIFLAAAAIHHHKESCTPASVTAELEHRQQADSGAHVKAATGLLHDLARAAAPAEPVVVHYAAIVRDLAALRRHAAARPEGLPSMPMRGFLTDDDT